MMRNFFKQPLLHFFFVGAAIFIIYSLNNEEPSIVEEKTIVVDRETLLNFMQFRANAFSPELFSESLDAMESDEVNALVKDYVREEVLYQEALAMGMNEGDYIIRQRLVQKVEFLLENLIADNLQPSSEELNEFYQARLGDYQVESVYSFTHIFFDGEKHGWEEAENLALDQLEISSDIAFSDASQFGDRYPFLQNYVERTHDYIVNNFNNDFVDALDNLDARSGQWQGPFSSRYGYHLVLLIKRSEPLVPKLEEILKRVEGDYEYETLLKSKRVAEEEVVDSYKVIMNIEPQAE